MRGSCRPPTLLAAASAVPQTAAAPFYQHFSSWMRRLKKYLDYCRRFSIVHLNQVPHCRFFFLLRLRRMHQDDHRLRRLRPLRIGPQTRPSLASLSERSPPGHSPAAAAVAGVGESSSRWLQNNKNANREANPQPDVFIRELFHANLQLMKPRPFPTIWRRRRPSLPMPFYGPHDK